MPMAGFLSEDQQRWSSPLEAPLFMSYELFCCDCNGFMVASAVDVGSLKKVCGLIVEINFQNPKTTELGPPKTLNGICVIPNSFALNQSPWVCPSVCFFVFFV